MNAEGGGVFVFKILRDGFDVFEFAVEVFELL